MTLGATISFPEGLEDTPFNQSQYQFLFWDWLTWSEFPSCMPFRQTDVQKYARAHIKSSELESEFILGTWLWIILKHAIGLTFHRSCCILSKNFRLFIFRSLFCISSCKCLKSYPNERTFLSRSGFNLHRFLLVLSHFRGFEPQPRTYFFLKSDIKWAFL